MTDIDINELPEKTGHYSLSDIGNADRFRQTWNSVAKYCFERKKWLIWNDAAGVWEWDNGALIGNLARITIGDIYDEAAREEDPAIRSSIGKHALRSESDVRINGMLNQAKSMSFVRYSQLDKNYFSLNLKNGTLDLRTGKLAQHEPHDYITTVLPIEYNPDSTCPKWLSFIDWMTCNDKELQEYLQRAVGYSLTGDVSAQVIFMLYGLGANGKSTFTGVIRKMLGPYADKVDVDDLLIKDKSGNGAAKPGIANLEGKRFVLTSEIPQGRKLNVNLIKDLSGEATLKARRLYEDGHEFEIHCKLWLQGNHMPEITDTTLSIWRRVKLIKCDATITDEQRVDGYMEQYLFPELEGILNWAVQGTLKYIQTGLGNAEAIRTATDKYKHDSDILIDFLEDACLMEPGATVTKTELKDTYQKWCQDNGIEPISQKTFKSRLNERGIIDYRIGKARSWKGIRLLTPDELVTRVTGVTDFSINPLSRGLTNEKFSENPSLLSPLNLISDKTDKNDGKKQVTRVTGKTINCPQCGKNEWKFADGYKTIKCPCGFTRSMKK